MNRIAALLCLAAVKAVGAEQEPGSMSRFDAPLSAEARKLSTTGGNPPASVARCGVAFPAGFDLRKTTPILVWNSPQTASAVDGLSSIAKAVTDSGWVALAADGAVPARVETTEWCAAMLIAAFDRLERSWPGVRRCPVAVAGFSGGAKRSAYIGAVLMARRQPLVGMFWGGCNEDRSGDALRWHRPGNAYKAVRIALSTGSRDPLVPAERAREVADSLATGGFANARAFPFEGEHEVDLAGLRAALAWFTSPH
jgi:predicted esterase